VGKIITLAIIGIIFIYVMSYILNPLAWPPQWLERREQWQKVSERVQSVGGWDAVKKDCELLASEHKNDTYDWKWANWDTNTLPPAIAALKPKSVGYFPPKLLEDLSKNNSEFVKYWGTNEVVRITIFGAHSTGGHDEPALWLDVQCKQNGKINSYNPIHLRSTTPFRYWRYKKVTDDIYESY
jgi:hypothetical protein